MQHMRARVRNDARPQSKPGHRAGSHDTYDSRDLRNLMVLVIGKDVEYQAEEAKEEGSDSDKNEELSGARIVSVTGSLLVGRLVRSFAQWKVELCGFL